MSDTAGENPGTSEAPGVRKASGVAVLIAAAIVGAGIAWYVAVTQPSRGGPLLGAAAPGFALARLEGAGSVSLDDLRGKVVYVNLWATWCAPCRDEAPSLQRLYEALHGEGFEIVAPTIDAPGDLQKVLAFRDELAIRYPILLDPDREVYQRYGATGVPETYLIDPEGRLAESYIGPKDWDDPRYARVIRELLAARANPAAGGG